MTDDPNTLDIEIFIRAGGTDNLLGVVKVDLVEERDPLTPDGVAHVIDTPSLTRGLRMLAVAIDERAMQENALDLGD